MAGYIGSKAAVVSSGAERKKTFDITTSTTSLTGLSYTVGQVHVFHNGVRLVDGTDYTATNSTSITLTAAAENGDQVVVVSYASLQVAGTYTKAEADAEFVNDPNGAITVDGSNVGIGTSSPSGGKLHITGSNYNDQLVIERTDTSSKWGVGGNTSGGFQVYDVNSGNATRMVIDSSGNVGIGTSSPVNNTNRTTLGLNGAWGGQLDIMVGSTVHAQFGTDNFSSGQSARIQSQDGIVFKTNGDNERMRLEAAGDLHVDGNVIAYSTTISDERLKTDIVKIDGALDKVAQLNGYTFTYTADGKKSAGVIAQEVQKVLPSAIVESTLPLKMGDDDETEYMTVQYDQLMGLMIEAIKELKAEVAELKGS